MESLFFFMPEYTPLMKQYFSIKEKYKDAILFFRLGDFYEMFYEDAKIASSILQITLTSRSRDSDEPIPMCGIPYFASDSYIAKLIKKGYKVAICEQVGDPKNAKGIVQREVIRVVTPGTFNPENPKENSFIVSIFRDGGKTGISAADISTGEFLIYETQKMIEDEIIRFQPKEIICPHSFVSDIHLQQVLHGYYISYADDSNYNYSEAYRTLLRYFAVSTLSGFGCDHMDVAISAAGALIIYLQETQKDIPFKKIKVLNIDSLMFLDSTSCRNLEIFQNLKDGSIEGSLLWVMDETLTPMGGRYLRKALINPLIDISLIHKRLNAVESFVDDFQLREGLKSAMRDIQDIERLTMKVSSKTATARDVKALKSSLSSLPTIKELLKGSDNPYLNELSMEIADFQSLVELINNAIVENPPNSLSDGGIIKSGYSREVDELREISSSVKDFIAKLESKERQRTSIQSLKIGYNRIFGYYIEVTKANLGSVPNNYIRKQTLVNAERFITEELKEYETKITEAEYRLNALEVELFNNLLEQIKDYQENLLNTSSVIAIVDFLQSLAIVAKKYDYAKPIVTNNDLIEIKEGRHPVLERLIAKGILNYADERFIANNTLLDCKNNKLLIITGPNMAGKSTFMRQTALIVLLAQIGSFVPARYANIGRVDRIFTRIGAVDFITKGQSTFMVEMAEVANILNNATDKSLVILDEVGRGTSTFDGVSIAWAIAEFLARDINCRTLFATHYHELADIVFTIEGAKNYNAVAREWGDEVIFLRKVEEGSADKSYGIHVARLAGLPQGVINRAKAILKKFEGSRFKDTASKRQMSLFSSQDSLAAELLYLNIDSLTPQRAKQKLIELKKKAEGMV